jgi:hypothetical protein
MPNGDEEAMPVRAGAAFFWEAAVFLGETVLFGEAVFCFVAFRAVR